MSRKPHPSSKLKTLSDEDQAALYEFMSDKKKTLKDGVDFIFSETGVRTSDTSLSDWREWYEMNLEISEFQSDRARLEAELKEQDVDPDLVVKLGEARFLGLAAKKGDVKMYAQVASIVQRHQELRAGQQAHVDKMDVKKKEIQQRDVTIKQKDREIAQKERRIAALEAQAAAAKAAAEKTKEALKAGGMDEKTRAELIKEMDRMILGKSADKPKA